MITKLDYSIGGFAGFFTGIFLIPTLFSVGVRAQFVLIALPLAVALLFAFGVWLGKFLSRWIPLMAQLAKFAAVGILNTTIDFGILNLLSAATGVTAGVVVGGVNVPGFSVAVVNSYLWNRLWVFRERKQEGAIFHNFPKFFGVTLIGLLINSGIIILLTDQAWLIPYLSAWPMLANEKVLLNVAKVLATLVSLIWNFAGYKFFVFKSK